MANAQSPLDGSHYQRRVTVVQGRDWPLAPGSLAAHMLTHGTLLVEYYAPRGTDTQKPHTRDELYVVISGNGWFVNGPERHEFARVTAPQAGGREALRGHSEGRTDIVN